MNVISTERLGYNYGRRRGIEDLDLTVGRGEIFGFLGPNGAGKTTTIRILLGLLRARTGIARVLNLECWTQSASIKRHVGYLPGDLRLYSWYTPKLALQLAAEVHKQRRVAQQGRQLLERFQLDENVPVRKMSRGMRQKLGLALALAHLPQLIILDEPTSGLDPLMCDELYGCLRELATNGTTIFFSSHTLSEVELLCERIAIVRAGRIVADEKMDSLRRQARREVIVRFHNEEAARSNPPDFLRLESRFGREWKAALIGPTPRLIAWAATQPLEDMSVSPPSLESLFRSYYRTAEEPE